MGLYPLDGRVPSSLTAQDAARWIYAANIELIRSADYVVANLDDFRGSGEPDCGTAFEVGFAVALGKPVWAYRSDNQTLIQRVETASIVKDGTVCSRGFYVEDCLSVNLMLACSARIVVGGAIACLDVIRRDLDICANVLNGQGVGKA